MKIDIEARTNGTGYWSTTKRSVRHRAMVLTDCARDAAGREWGALQVRFTKKDWDISKHGLIYTDDQWIRDFCKGLRAMGFSAMAVATVDYSEQGRQGDNYVDLDVGSEFIAEWFSVTGEKPVIDTF